MPFDGGLERFGKYFKVTYLIVFEEDLERVENLFFLDTA